MNSAPCLYFSHIPKTAGTSVRVWLLTNFDPATVFRFGILDELYATPREKIRQHSIFAGHFGGYLDSLLEMPTRRFTVLREPVARTVSHWWQIRRSPWHPAYERVCNQSLEEFVSDEANRVCIENFQARYLARPQADLDVLAHGMTTDDLLRYRLSQRAEDTSLGTEPDVLFARATDALSSMEVVGTADDVYGFLVSLAERFARPKPSQLEIPHANKTDDVVEISIPVRRAIERATEIDRALYDAVKAEWSVPRSRPS